MVANFSHQPRAHYVLGLPAADRWIVRFNSDSRYYDKDFGDFGDLWIDAEAYEQDGLPACGNMNVAAYSALILSRESQ
jgi:1,4-alpha-glucan branching enzyme